MCVRRAGWSWRESWLSGHISHDALPAPTYPMEGLRYHQRLPSTVPCHLALLAAPCVSSGSSCPALPSTSPPLTVSIRALRLCLRLCLLLLRLFVCLACACTCAPLLPGPSLPASKWFRPGSASQVPSVLPTSPLKRGPIPASPPISLPTSIITAAFPLSSDKAESPIP